MLTEVFARPGVGEPGDAAFAVARGYVEANRERSQGGRRRRVRSPAGRLEAQVAAALGGYRVVTWRDRCPEEYLESFGER